MWKSSSFGVLGAVASLLFCCSVIAFAPPPSRESSRRNFLEEIISASTSVTMAALVFNTKKEAAVAVAPFAPSDALLPATRVKVMIDNAVEIASKLDAAQSFDVKQSLLSDLENLLLKPQNFLRGTTPIDVPQQPAKSYLDAYADYRSRVSILEKPGAMLVQNGEIDAWKRLKRQEKAREDADEIRAALNYYTSNLNFNSDKFILTASRVERSRMIREDRIPDVKTVIASDMGLRYLLRNDVLTAMDDARAELTYQMKQFTTISEATSIDGKDLLDLLLAAQSACNKWFDLIEEQSVQEALTVVRKET
jgi:hypothetical protein